MRLEPIVKKEVRTRKRMKESGVVVVPMKESSLSIITQSVTCLRCYTNRYHLHSVVVASVVNDRH